MRPMSERLRPDRHRKRRRAVQAMPALESLPDRVLMAANVTMVDGIIKIDGTASADVCRVESQGQGLTTSIRVACSIGGRGTVVKTFPSLFVHKVEFHGFDGDDDFRNLTALPSEAWWRLGND